MDQAVTSENPFAPKSSDATNNVVAPKSKSEDMQLDGSSEVSATGEENEASADLSAALQVSNDANKIATGSSTSKTETNDDIDRLAVAIRRSMQRLTPEPQESGLQGSTSRPAITPTEDRYITLSFNGGKAHVVPYALCRTWEDMEALLKFHFAEDEKALDEIEKGQYDVQLPYHNRTVILPQTWEHVVTPEWKVDILLKSHTAIKDPDDSNEPKQYENRVGYTVSYYEKDRYTDRKTLLGRTTYQGPVEFELDVTQQKVLPVLEEKKVIDMPWSYDEAPKTRFDENNRRQKARLGEFDEVSKAQVQIHSPYLLNVLRAVVEFSSEAPSGEGDTLGRGIFTYPYKDLYHHMDDLKAYKAGFLDLRSKHSDVFNKNCDQHIDLLLNYLSNQPNISLQQLEAPWAKKNPVTTFAALWLLLKPGSDMYVREADGSLNAYVLDTLEGGVEDDKRGKRRATEHTALVWNLSFNGTEIFRRTRVVSIPVFDNEREITSLPMFPVRFVDDFDNGATRAQLIERGEKYFQYSKGPSFLQYSGVGMKPGRRNYKRTRVVVEHASMPWWDKAFEKLVLWKLDDTGDRQNIGETTRVPRCECTECAPSHKQEIYAPLKYSDYDKIDPKSKLKLSWHQNFLLSSHMFAFILKDRTYDLLDVAGLKEVVISENAIDALEMDKANKETIKAIAKTYTDNDSQTDRFSADFIQGKGEGQIILLHGPPGTGKTLTAESVAEFTRRPLLSITAADLGHEPDELEKNLLRFFRDANDWDAIVLLDEADVYLERRSISDLRRNSIVSIFLRALDYFQGILFLTTNRVGQFDEAFMARIHVSIGYKRLDDESRGRIWDNLFRKLKEDRLQGGPEIHYDWDAKEYVQRSSEVKVLKWNGREIRNAFQTAVALAVYDSKVASEKAGNGKPVIPEVKEVHLRQIVSMSSAFSEYITSTHEDIGDSDLAYKYGNRNDRFQEGGSKA